MSFQAVPGLPFIVIPDSGLFRQSGSDGFDDQHLDLTTASAAVHFTGKVIWRDHGTHRISSAGGKIGWRTHTGVVWNSDGSQLTVGIQDLSGAAGPPARGDGAFDVYKILERGIDTIASSTWYETAMSNGTKDIATGAVVTVVFEFTTKIGSDAVIVWTHGAPTNGLVFSQPVAILYNGTTYSYPGQNMPHFVLYADDGTLGTFVGTWPVDGLGQTTGLFTSASSPPEYANLFSLPWACRISGMWVVMGDNAQAGSAELNLYANPLDAGSVTSVASAVFTARSSNAAGAVDNSPEKIGWYMFTTPYDYTANTTMAMAVRSTDATNKMEIAYFNAPTAATLDLHQLGQNCRAVSRNTVSSATAFSTYGATRRRMEMGLLISHFHDGPSGGSILGGPLT